MLTKEEIDNIAEDFLKDFNLKVLQVPQPIDEDRFLTEYLGLIQDFQYLFHNGCYLSMLVFESSTKVVVYNIYNNRAEYINSKTGTVIIDNRLLEENQQHRYRFTVIYEAANWIFYRNEYYCNFFKLAVINRKNDVNIKCTIRSIYDDFKPLEEWDHNDTIDSQVNYFTVALLMPKSMVFKICNDKKYIEELRFMSLGNQQLYNELLIIKISKVFDVSKKLAKVRLNNLKIIKNKAV